MKRVRWTDSQTTVSTFFTVQGSERSLMNIDLHRDGIRAAGCWECYVSRIRAGQSWAEANKHFEWEHSEEFVKGLAERGFTLYITQFSKGHGIETERPWMERTKELVELCHRYGIAVGGYVRYTTIVPETLKLEVPDCVERFAGRTASGAYARYVWQYWRYIPCPCSQDWLDYFDRVIEIGVNEVRLDLLHVDGTTLWPEPEACHCPRCHAAFVEYLEQQYPEREARLRHFGFADLDHIELPYFGEPGAFQRPSRLRDPVSRDWVLFRCARMTAIWDFIVEAVKRRRPEVWVEGNIKYEPGLNTAWQHSNDLYALHQVPGEGFFTEEANSPELRSDGVVLSYIPTFKKARQFRKRIFAYNRSGPPDYREFNDPERLSLGYAHQLAFNNDAMGCHVQFPVGGFPVSHEPYVRFHRQHRDLYDSGEIIADVGVYYSTRSLTFSFEAPHLQIILAQQTLIHERIPFRYLFGEEVRSAGDFRVVVLPGMECMSEEEAAALAEYVRQGGGLVIAGDTATRDENGYRLSESRLAAPLGLDWTSVGEATRADVGKGRVAFIRRLLPDAENIMDDGAQSGEWVEDFAKASDYHYAVWRSPANAAEYLDALRWAAGGFTYEASASRGVVCEYVRQQEKNRDLIHLVNFDLERDAAGIEILCRGRGPVKAEVLTPDVCGAEVATHADDSGTVIRLARLHRYAVVILSADAVE